MTGTPDLAALIGSRICHDLISPIGAIGNGVELLLMDGSDGGPEIAMIADSVGHANGRIRFFRVAFGLAVEGQRMARAEIVPILADMTRGGRLVIDWDSPPDVDRAEAKIAFLLIQCLEHAMPYGGRVAVSRDGGSLCLDGQAAKLRIDDRLWGHLADPSSAIQVTAAEVQFALARVELSRRDRDLSVVVAEQGVHLAF